MVNAKPLDKFIKICICFIVIELPDGIQHSVNDNFWHAEQCRLAEGGQLTELNSAKMLHHWYLLT